MKSTNEVKNGETVYTYENGVTLSKHSVNIPQRGEVGPIGFPIRHQGDVFHVFHVFRMAGEAEVTHIPQSCRAW